MKPHFILQPLALSLFLCGCQTTGPNANLPLIAGLARTAAAVGTQYQLQQHPDQRPAFEAAKVALDRLIGDGQYDPAAFAAVLQELPIKEFKGPEGALYVQGAVAIFELATSQEYLAKSPEGVKAIMLATRAGIQSGLVSTAARAARGGDGPRVRAPGYPIKPARSRDI